MKLSGAARETVARILEAVAHDGLPDPSALDEALDALGSALKSLGINDAMLADLPSWADDRRSRCIHRECVEHREYCRMGEMDCACDQILYLTLELVEEIRNTASSIAYNAG